MSNDLNIKYDNLRKKHLEYLDLNQSEQNCLKRVINTLGVVAGMRPTMVEGVREITKLVSQKNNLPIKPIDDEVNKLKTKIISETEESDESDQEQIEELKNRLLELCRLVQKIMLSFLEGFYPMSKGLAAKASAIQINCKDDPEKIQFEKASSALLDFSKDLKGKIESDFKYISGTFLSLLKHVKELERSFTSEFGGEKQVKEVEYFEMKINEDVSSILRSFDVYSTIGEIKSAVLNKIENIKRAVSLRKRKEKVRAQIAKENMKKLRERIVVAEKEAHEMSRTAEQHKMAAMKDGLTELYNRKALDVRLKGAFKMFHETNRPFSLFLFDIDKFKNINDNFGHVAGDTVLKKVAQCLKETFRESDFISRYGGDEFVVIIEKLTEKMALEKISSFTESLGKKRFVSHKKGEINITVSAGFSFSQEGDTPEKLFEKADKNMYTAKSRRKKQK